VTAFDPFDPDAIIGQEFKIRFQTGEHTKMTGEDWERFKEAFRKAAGMSGSDFVGHQFRADSRFKREPDPGNIMPHGTQARYEAGCRCDKCTLREKVRIDFGEEKKRARALALCILTFSPLPEYVKFRYHQHPDAKEFLFKWGMKIWTEEELVTNRQKGAVAAGQLVIQELTGPTIAVNTRHERYYRIWEDQPW
jgi:hypothetical protein